MRIGWRLAAGLFGIAGALGLAALPMAQPSPFDVVIKGGRIVDGTGAPWFIADVAVKGDMIVALAPRIEPGGARVIDAKGLIVAPGFIDVHSHSEFADQGLAAVPTAENNVRQGVTTVFANPDGRSELPLAPFLQRVAAARPTINLGAFVGHGSVRASVVGMANRPATSAELERMRALVRASMEEGAFGLSTGLFYVPANYAPLDEIVELASVAGSYGGIHQSHMRDEAKGVLGSVRETIAIGERGGLPTQVTHHKIVGKAYWGRSVDTLKLIDDARARGVDATIDQYPYTASSTSIEAGLIPQWAQEGGRQQMLARLQAPATATRLRLEIADLIENERGGGDPANVVLAACDFDAALAGKSLAQVLRERQRAPTSAEAADLVVEIVQKGGCRAVFHAIGEDDLVRILKHPATMIASDAAPGEPEFGRDVPHPRAYGTFARVLGVYVREKGALSLEDAVRKMTGYPAARMRLADRGLLRPGMKADIVVFDAATIKDRATFEQPHQYAEGVHVVLVNGQTVLENGKLTGARPGRVLYGPGYHERR
jgi:dihydroorotase/N-acyl-D-amino-acid deacylase